VETGIANASACTQIKLYGAVSDLQLKRSGLHTEETEIRADESRL
jgi:hypothetical protein